MINQQSKSKLGADDVNFNLARIDTRCGDKPGPEGIVGTTSGRAEGLALKIFRLCDVALFEAQYPELGYVVHHGNAGQRKPIIRELYHRRKVDESVIVLTKR